MRWVGRSVWVWDGCEGVCGYGMGGKECGYEMGVREVWE